MRTLGWSAVVLAAVVVGVAASTVVAQPIAPSAGPTRIKIAAGLVSAEDTRAGLLGVWEPAAELGLPAGSNHIIYLADGLYINPFRNVALIGFWSATADTLTSTPFDIRQLEDGTTSPELKDLFKQIAWDQPTVTKIKWLAPDRFEEDAPQGAKRRAQPAHDITKVHRAVAAELLRGAWIKPGGTAVIFEVDGTFREQRSAAASYAGAQAPLTGTYDFDAAGGLLRANTEVNSASRAARIFQMGSRTPSTLRWASRGVVAVDGERWTRRAERAATGGRGFLGVTTSRNGASIASIAANSPAASVGLRPGDVIVGLDGEAVASGVSFRSDIAARKPGDRIELTVARGSDTSTLVATLAAGADGGGSLGVALALAGAVVTGVQAGSPAERAGLQIGDQIEGVDARRIQDGADLVSAVQALAPGTTAVFTVVRGGTRIERRVTIGSLPQ